MPCHSSNFQFRSSIAQLEESQFPTAFHLGWFSITFSATNQDKLESRKVYATDPGSEKNEERRTWIRISELSIACILTEFVLYTAHDQWIVEDRVLGISLGEETSKEGVVERDRERSLTGLRFFRIHVTSPIHHFRAHSSSFRAS